MTRHTDSATASILIIDDDAPTRAVMRDILSDAGYRTILWDGVEDPRATLARTQPDLVIQDIRLATDLSIWDLLEHIERQEPARSPAILLCSADRAFIRAHREALEARSCAIVEKPFDLDHLLATVASCLQPLGSLGG